MQTGLANKLGLLDHCPFSVMWKLPCKVGKGKQPQGQLDRFQMSRDIINQGETAFAFAHKCRDSEAWRQLRWAIEWVETEGVMAAYCKFVQKSVQIQRELWLQTTRKTGKRESD